MTRFDAVRALRAAAPADALVVACNGMIGRELFSAGDRPEHFYMVGSMGLASSVGLGLALAMPTRTVVVADGDGNVLMGLGALASVAAVGPSRFYHIVFDNHAHASTGGQRTVSDRVAIERIALAAGYRRASRLAADADPRPGFEALFAGSGPAMLLLEVEPGNVPGIGRVEVTPPDLARRFRTAAGGGDRW